MLRKERASHLLCRLDEHYPDPPIPLDHSDPFSLLIAVLLSAQCTDKKVNEVTPALFAAGPTPSAMAALTEAEIFGHIRQLGLAKTKARNVHKLSHLLIAVHGGNVPNSFEALEALPGVGHKTASVVMAQAFGVPAFPVDTHIHRLAQRWGLSNGDSGELEQTSPANYFLWTRVLHCSRMRWNRLPHVPGAVSKATSASALAKALAK